MVDVGRALLKSIVQNQQVIHDIPPGGCDSIIIPNIAMFTATSSNVDSTSIKIHF